MMNDRSISSPALFFAGDDLTGRDVVSVTRRLRDLEGIFYDCVAFEAMDPETIAYEVKSFLPVPEGTPGGLYFGITRLHAGNVGGEYFMTKGHFHANRDRAEYYWGLTGEGMLLFMDDERNVRAERMTPGSLHYIPGGVAHRVANTGGQLLSFAACWPSDAGHNYGEIAEHGFSARLVETGGKPELIKNDGKI
jgi:glucose-6-phosphate isomerase